ncbi:MAG: universal stress protein [Sandarakinorhabdus sp.]|nr:universal stress protein [Sandarakinorhabdus sp.]
MLHVHQDAEQDNRLQVAIDLARLSGGRIACVQVAGALPHSVDFHGEMLGLAAIIDTIHDQDRMLRQDTEARLRRAGIEWDWRCFDGGVVEALIAQSRLADIIVVSQPIARRPAAGQPLPIVGDVVVHTSAPVLMVPAGRNHFDAAGPAIMAWNGSAEAAHAMRLAVPLLQRASCVHLVEVTDDAPGAPASEAATYLARHNIICEVHEWPPKGRQIALALLHAAAELEARYLVMGAYGHNRLRETILGGVTRDLIHSTTVPLLLAH